MLLCIMKFKLCKINGVFINGVKPQCAHQTRVHKWCETTVCTSNTCTEGGVELNHGVTYPDEHIFAQISN